MPIAAPIAAIIGGGLAAGGSIAAGVLGSGAAKTAANEQAQAEQNALDFQKQVFATQQATQAPFVQAGTTRLADLMAGFDNGTFGPGSIAPFQAPTLAEAQSSPGYQFAAEQGAKGILQASAATGGAISGGTAKSLEQYETGLANQTYNDVFTRAMQQYQAQLQGQAQAFGQLYTPVALGETAAANINATGSQAAQSITQLMGNIGSAQAAGTVGSANALGQGITGGANSILQSVLLSQLMSRLPTSPGALPAGWQGPLPAIG